MRIRAGVQRDAVDGDRRRLTIGVVTATVLMSSGAMVIFPLLPSLQSQLGISTADIGFVAAAGFAASLAAELIVAPYADRGRARTMGVVGMVLMAAALLGSALATESWHLIAGRALGGFGFGAFMAAASALLVRADPARAGESLGRLGAAELAGVSLGPLASGLAIAFTTPGTILAWSGAVVLLGVIPVALTFRERAAAAAQTTDAAAAGATGVHGAAASADPAPPPRVSLDLLRSPHVVGVLLLYGAVMVPTGAYDAIWPRFMADIGASEWLTALSYTLFAVPFALVASWAGRLADRRGGVSAFVRGAVVLVPIVALYGVVGDPWVATGVGFVESSGQALAFIGAAAAMAQAVPAARAGASQGLMRAFGLLTATLAAALSGVAYEAGGALALFGGTAVVVVLMIAGGLLVLRAARVRRASTESPRSPATAAAEAETDARPRARAELSDERACAPTRA
ncbi:putative MFS family arabinose efflux permease [Agromyces ramosus]|uniref:Putative MFS family arabinose efflux permease n=1 Tax=Agromyces ramosus TaxID=33879 RepID=A0A4Q7MA08_9MICO|nr:MFS transporter [Agromyces ramosus]RZS64806.1 putative MFS family arabinose efflux permease [Agromyces ramosus]